VTHPTSADLVVGIPHRRHRALRCYPRGAASAVRREVGESRRTVAHPASSRRFPPLTSLSRCGCPALEPLQLEALRPRCGPLPFPERSFASGEDVYDVTHRREPPVPPVPHSRESRDSLNDPDAFSRVELAARARERASDVSWKSLAGSSYSLVEPHRPPFDRRPLRPARDFLSAWSPASLSLPFGSLSGPFRRCSRLVLRRPRGAPLSMRVARLGGWIAFPRDPTGSLCTSFHSCEEPGELGHLPSCLAALRPLPRALLEHGGLATLQGAQRFALGLPGTRGARPGGDPGPFDRCLLLTDSVLKELSEMLPKSRCTPQHIPTRWGSSRFTPSEPASASRRAVRSVVFSGFRRAGVPLMPRRPAGTPGGAASTGVGPRSCALRRSDLGSSRRPRPLPPSRVNGSWLRTGPRHLLSSAHSRRPLDRALRDVSRSRSRAPATRYACPTDVARR
jgi:hypothetical protein